MNFLRTYWLDIILQTLILLVVIFFGTMCYGGKCSVSYPLVVGVMTVSLMINILARTVSHRNQQMAQVAPVQAYSTGTFIVGLAIVLGAYALHLLEVSFSGGWLMLPLLIVTGPMIIFGCVRMLFTIVFFVRASKAFRMRELLALLSFTLAMSPLLIYLSQVLYGV